MITHSTTEAMVAWSDSQRRAGRRIGLVPTMGFLHDGHASLMRRLRPEVDVLVVSIYVNPLQFGPHEDLDRYPRDPVGDTALCAREGVDALFMPPSLYPDDFSTAVTVRGLSEGLCGANRPGHFDGVTTVVNRLFGLTRCDVAVFGEKDYQQLAVLRRMVRDLAMPVEVLGAPLIRDTDGLALSSRNKYLSPDERRRALSLHHVLFAMADAVEAGQTDPQVLIDTAMKGLEADRLDYLTIVDPDTLQPVVSVVRPARALVAGHFGNTRLIDNVALHPGLV